jgi:hypothetical protein
MNKLIIVDILRAREIPGLHPMALMMEAVISSETSVNFYKTTWHNVPIDSHFHRGLSLSSEGHVFEY